MDRRKLELWGGHECTVSRVGEVYTDQTRLSGHHNRIDDLDRFAALGVRKLRYPVLWERTAPDHPEVLDFGWSDSRLQRLDALGVEPIIGLLHHGSGPAYTSLIDPTFPQQLATFARQVATRYPTVLDWSPVNEPLTTARFTCLYGHWSPHRRDEESFWLALTNQIDGVRLAMQEIRKIQPAARLVQTEDLGRTYSTAGLTSQADFENGRRWLTWDLLCGSVTPDHPMYDRMAAAGLGDRLRAMAAAPCPPDVIGVNHYLTSDRFLDEDVAAYPADRRGGNDVVAYADVEAIRVLEPAPGGLMGVLEEAWQRYGRPLALTEIHNGCTREDQVRWLHEAWEIALDLRRRGVPIEAVTAWALLGSHDWDSLLTQRRGHYETGAFDTRSGALRPTAVAKYMMASISGGQEPHAVAGGNGWWRRDIRLAFPPSKQVASDANPVVRPSRTCKPLLIAGATGVLGAALARACDWRGIPHVLTNRAVLDLSNWEAMASTIDTIRPWAVINAAGWVRVDDAETRAGPCFDANALGAGRLSQICGYRDIPLVGFSSDLVFDGSLQRGYVEDDATAPLNVYGRSKVMAETLALGGGAQNLMIRTAAFFSRNDPYNFAVQVEAKLRGNQEFQAADDTVVSPTYVPDLANAVLDLLIDQEVGLWHLANQGAATWADFARRIAVAAGLDAGLVTGVPAASFNWPAQRPLNSALRSKRGDLMPTLDDAIARYAVR